MHSATGFLSEDAGILKDFYKSISKRLINKRSMQRAFSYIALVVLILAAASSYAQQIPPPGTSIDNQARVRYVPASLGDTVIIHSNTVSAIIQAADMVSLEPNNQRRVRSGQSATFAHKLTNSGNTSETLIIRTINSSEKEQNLAELRLSTKQKQKSKRKENTNTTASASSDSIIVTLAPKEIYTFDVFMRLSSAAQLAEQAKVTVQAKTEQGSIVQENIDILTALEGPVINVEKQQLEENAGRGEPWGYQITALNTGDQTAQPVKITLDGALQTKILLRDHIPANTVFETVTDDGGGTPIYHIIGSADKEYTSTRPSDLSTMDEIAIVVDSLSPGQTLDPKFTVTVNDNAVGTIRNTAQMEFRDPIDDEGQTSEVQTNTVEFKLPKDDGSLDYFTDDSYNKVSRAARLGQPLRLQANAARANVNFSLRDTVTVILTSQKTDDRERFKAIETTYNSGIFRVMPSVRNRSAEEFEVIQGNGIYETLENDVISASIPDINDQEKAIFAQLVVSPFGVVFDSQTGEPVANAVIELIEATGNGNGDKLSSPAQVFDEDGDEQIANPQTTTENGKFAFPYVLPGTYRIKVTPPVGYGYASNISVDELPAGRTADAKGSYGKEFTVADQPGPVAFDIPIDPDVDGDLFVEKTSSTANARIGDFVTYQIKVSNNSAGTVKQVRIEDTLPFGFRYEQGTVSLDGVPIEDPIGGKGPSLNFVLGDLEANKTVAITYRVLLGAGVRNGEATSSAIARSDEPVTRISNESQNTIDVRGGVFTDKGYIIGKVFADCNENNVQDPGEPGVPGVRLYLENGSFVITDPEGKYTFYGIRPNKHVVKLDNYSLPKGSKLGVLDNRQAGDASSRFVNLKNGQMHRADFSICNCTEEVHAEIDARRDQYGTAGNNELEASVKRDFSVDNSGARTSQKQEQASGVINGSEIPDTKQKESGGVSNTAEDAETAAVSDTAMPDALTLEEAMIHENAELGFIGLVDNDTLQTAQTRIWIKGPLGATLTLNVNGKKIGDARISKKSKLAELSLQAQEYIGTKLKAGKNTITVSQTDAFGNERGSKKITVFAPGRVDKIGLTVPVNNVPADGASAALVRIQLLDESGIAVKSRVPVTLDVSAGEWLVNDNDPSTPGTQTYIEKGVQEVELKSTIRPQDAKVRISVGALEAETTIHFLPDLRPLIAAGVIEGTIRLNDGTSLVPARSADGFERELKLLSYSTGNTTADARAAFFLKGKIKGNMLLTAGFDSEKNDDQLFRDIQPDEFYPVYGESSVKGYDAQSTSRLYVRVDHKRTYALYGDFVTQQRHPAKSLGEYNRTQTGLKFHYEKDRVRLNAFGSQASSLRRIDEFRGQGISGPYVLDSDNILVNSEQVEIITRDRNQPSVVISREQLSRFRDYVIEPFTGNLMFKSAVSSVDEELNPVFVRVTYEVEDGASSYLIGGADGQLKVTDFLELGGSFVEDRNPEDKYRLKSINSTVRFDENTILLGEVAESTTELEGSGRGGRVELQHKGDKVDARVFAGQTDRDFVNRSSQLGQARTEAGARGSVELTNSTDLRGEFLYSSNDTLENNTTGGLLSIEQKLTDDIRAEVGVRYSRRNQSQTGSGSANQADIAHKNIRSKLSLGVPKVKGASVFGEYEQDIRENERKLIAVGGDYRLNNIGKLYARHEFISSALGPYNLNSNTRRQNTVAGIDAEYMKNGNVYSEYRVDDAFDGQNAQAAIGLRNRFQIYEGFGINAGFERIFSITGDPLNEGTAISSAVDYTANPLWKGTARAEARFSNNGNSYLNTLGYGRKISTNWTFLGKNIFNLQTSINEGAPDRIQQRLRAGFAYRQTGQNRWDGLGRYELKYEEDGQFGGDFNRALHIFSTNVNYHPSSDWTYSGRLAAKKIAESSAEFDSESLTTLLSARSIYDISRKLDGGVNARLMSDAGFGAKDYGLGLELGYILQRNLRLAVGFNVFGFEDRDLTASNYTRKGAFVGFSYKFDERLFRGLTPDADHNRQVYARCNECAESAVHTKILRMPEPDFDDIAPPQLTIAAPELRKEIITPKTRLAKNIHFSSEASSLSKKSKEILDRMADYWMRNDQFEIEITGYTDSRGSDSYNMKLSKRRASAVKQYLISRGVNTGLIKIKGLGEQELSVSPEQDAIDYALNRRVEFNLDIPNINVRFIQQYDDLKIEIPQGASKIDWDYLFNTELKAVPDRIHITAEALGHTTQYLLNRIRLALQYHPEEETVFRVAGPHAENRKRLITSFLKEHGADMKRIRIQVTPGNAKGGLVKISYGKNSRLSPVTQRDDVRFTSGKYIEPLLSKMLKLLEQ